MEKREKVKAPVVVHNQLYKDIYAFVSKRIGNQEDVADLVQDIFLKLQENQAKLRDQDLVVPWLYRVTRNQIVDFYRKNGKVAPELVEEIDIYEDETFQEVASWLSFFINVMSEEDQQILQLTEMEAKTQREAAEIIGISTDAAKARHQRAKKRLKANLEKCCKYSFDSRGRVIDYELRADDCCE